MTTINRTIKGVFLGLAMASATVFEANGCSMNVDNLDSVTSLVKSLVGNGVDFSFNSTPQTDVTSPTARGDTTDPWCGCSVAGF